MRMPWRSWPALPTIGYRDCQITAGGGTITGDSDLMGNSFTIGHGLNPDNITQNYGIAGLEICITLMCIRNHVDLVVQKNSP